jgi:hypothetical protein
MDSDCCEKSLDGLVDGFRLLWKGIVLDMVWQRYDMALDFVRERKAVLDLDLGYRVLLVTRSIEER